MFPEPDVERGGDPSEGASRRLRHHLRALPHLGRSPPRRPRSLLLLQVSVFYNMGLRGHRTEFLSAEIFLAVIAYLLSVLDRFDPLN